QNEKRPTMGSTACPSQSFSHQRRQSPGHAVAPPCQHAAHPFGPPEASRRHLASAKLFIDHVSSSHRRLTGGEKGGLEAVCSRNTKSALGTEYIAPFLPEEEHKGRSVSHLYIDTQSR